MSVQIHLFPRAGVHMAELLQPHPAILKGVLWPAWVCALQQWLLKGSGWGRWTGASYVLVPLVSVF